VTYPVFWVCTCRKLPRRFSIMSIRPSPRPASFTTATPDQRPSRPALPIPLPPPARPTSRACSPPGVTASQSLRLPLLPATGPPPVLPWSTSCARAWQSRLPSAQAPPMCWRKPSGFSQGLPTFCVPPRCRAASVLLRCPRGNSQTYRHRPPSQQRCRPPRQESLPLLESPAHHAVRWPLGRLLLHHRKRRRERSFRPARRVACHRLFFSLRVPRLVRRRLLPPSRHLLLRRHHHRNHQHSCHHRRHPNPDNRCHRPFKRPWPLPYRP